MQKHRHRREIPLIEPLESRQLLSAAISVAPHGPAHFVVQDNSMTLLGTLPNIKVNLPGEDPDRPVLHATVQWGDGTSSDAVLQRDANGRVQIWAGHAYDTVNTYKLTILTDTGSTPKITFKNSAIVSLNATRGRTITTRSDFPFTGVVATLERTKGLPVFTSPQSSISLPPGSQFCQYTVGDQGAIAVARIDWGDGTVSDGTFVTKGANYNVSGTHTYAAGGAYRIVINVIIETADHSVLHIDMINSAARVNGTHILAISPPPHSQVDLTNLLPQGTILTLTNPGTGSSSSTTVSGGAAGVVNFVGVTVSSGASAGVLTINGNHLTTFTGATTVSNVGLIGAGSGTLHLTGGVLSYLPNQNLGGGGTLVLGHGGGSFTGGTVTVNFGPGGTVVPIFNNTGSIITTGGSIITSGSITIGTTPLNTTGSGYILVGPTSFNDPLIPPHPATGLDVGSSLVVTYDQIGTFCGAFLLDPSADTATELALDTHFLSVDPNAGIKTTLANNRIVSTNGTQGSSLLLSLVHAGNLIFNLSNSADQVLSLLNALPADFTGNISFRRRSISLRCPLSATLATSPALPSLPVPLFTSSPPLAAP